MKNSKLILVILTTVLVTGLVVGTGFYLYGSRLSQASAEGTTHVHEDGTSHVHTATGHENEPPAPLMAIVDKVEGKKISVKEAATGMPQSFDLADNAEIHRQEIAQLSDIKPGTAFTAIGPEKDGVIQAEVMLLGEKASFGNRLPVENEMASAPAPQGGAAGTVAVAPAPGGAAGAPPALSGQAPVNIELPAPVIGTVEQIDGNTLTVKTQEGKTTKVQVTEKAIFQKYVDAQASEIAAGKSIMVLPAIGTDPMRVRILLTPNK